MPKPINRTKQKRNYFLVEALLYVFILFIACHVGRSEKEGIYALLDGLDHVTKSPLAIFPINWMVVRSAMLLGLIPVLMIHTEFLKRIHSLLSCCPSLFIPRPKAKSV